MQASPKAKPADATSKSVERSKFDRAILKELPAIGPDVNWPKLSADWTDPVVLKESWPLLDRAMIETEMFQAVQDRHGIPVVVGAVSYPHMMDMFTGLMDLKVCDDFLEVYSDPKMPLEIERRALVRMICSTRGMSVMGIANNPQRLVKALIDSMIGKFLETCLADVFIADAGHLQLFWEGYLHRDVTIGNVLVRHNPQERSMNMRLKNDGVLSCEK